MSFRSDDTRPMPFDSNREPPVKITREIPLWGLICMLGALAGQGIAMYYSLDRQAEKQKDSTEAIRALSGKIDKFSDDNNTRNAKDAEHDWKLADHERRLSTLEVSTRTLRP